MVPGQKGSITYKRQLTPGGAAPDSIHYGRRAESDRLRTMKRRASSMDLLLRRMTKSNIRDSIRNKR